jgi:hypothetical protein
MVAPGSTSDRRDRVRPPGMHVARRDGRRRRQAAGSPRRPPRLAIVVQGGAVQGIYGQRCGSLTVYLLDYDDLQADGDLAEQVVASGELPQILVEAGLRRAVAEYRAAATRQAQLQRAAEVGR